MVLEKAKRLVEHKKDVVILLDSITRLPAPTTRSCPLRQGPLRRRGLERAAAAQAVLRAARNVEEGGSLTIIASALVRRARAMDDVIFEEFKGTGNAEIVLDRSSRQRGVPVLSTSTAAARARRTAPPRRS